MYWLPRAAVTSHKRGGFKQHQLFSLSSGDQRSLAWVCRRAASIEESEGASLPCSSPASGARQQSLAFLLL